MVVRLKKTTKKTAAACRSRVALVIAMLLLFHLMYILNKESPALQNFLYNMTMTTVTQEQEQQQQQQQLEKGGGIFSVELTTSNTTLLPRAPITNTPVAPLDAQVMALYTDTHAPVAPTVAPTTRTPAATGTAVQLVDLDHDNDNDNDNNDLVPAHHFCRLPNITLVDKDGTNQTFLIGFHCEGPHYNNFTQDLLALVVSNPYRTSHSHSHIHSNSNSSSRTTTSTAWGRRKYPLPARKSVIAIGNSHMRQHLTALVCQYAGVITHALLKGGVKSNHVVAHFDNNSTLTWVANTPVEIAKDWETRLQAYTHQPLTNYDGVLFGQFNNGGGMTGDLKHTKYYQQMMNLSKHDAGLDFEHQKPPNIVDISRAFPDGPIVFATNYDSSPKTRSYVDNVVKLMSLIEEEEQTNTTTVANSSSAIHSSRFRVVQSRKYIPLLNNNECGSDNYQGTFWCHHSAGHSHQCMGTGGGHPDLIAFDLVETFFELFAQQQQQQQ